MAELALIDAINRGELEKISLLLASGHDPNEASDEGWTALMYAAQNGDAKLTRELLAAGADPNPVNRHGASALTLARGAETLDCILDAAVSRESRLYAMRVALSGNEVWRALRVAACMDAAERELHLRGIGLVEASLRAGKLQPELAALINIPGREQVVRTYGGLALIHGGGCLGPKDKALELPRRLLALGADPNEQVRERSPLRKAIEMRHPGLVGLLLEHGADPNAVDPAGETPLMILSGYCLRYEDRRGPVRKKLSEIDAIQRLLLAAGADVNAARSHGDSSDPAGRTALMYFLIMYPDHVQRLLEAGASAVAADAEGWTVLHFCRQVAIAKRLKALGADPAASTRGGETPLHRAIRAGNLPMVKWLWTHAGVRAAAAADPSVRALAGAGGNAEIAEWLAAQPEFRPFAA